MESSSKNLDWAFTRKINGAGLLWFDNKLITEGLDSE